MSRVPLRSYGNVVAAALLVALLLRGCVLQGFKVPSASMLPTLQVGDHIFASPLSYGIPLPLAGGWLWRHAAPRPGDVVVLEKPGEPERYYVKRVAAVGGEIVEIHGGTLVVDGHRRDLGITAGPLGASSDFGPVRVPPDHLFVLGDNWYQSIDSRDWGPVETAGIKGRVLLIYWSQRKSGGSVRWERLGSRVH